MNTKKRIICLVLTLAIALSCAVLAGCGTKNEIKGINTNTSKATTSATEAVTQAVATTSAASSDYNYTPNTDDKKDYKPIELEGYKKQDGIRDKHSGCYGEFRQVINDGEHTRHTTCGNMVGQQKGGPSKSIDGHSQIHGKEVLYKLP